MASPQQIQYITQRAQALGLDPRAVLAIAGHEGIGGGIGDGGHAFGPFQMNNAGGVLTGKFAGQTPQQINEWAWSNEGIDHALAGMAPAARGLKGRAAIEAIATKYERPADPGAEIADAMSHYGGNLGSAAPQPNLPAPSLGTEAGGSPTRQQLAQLVFAGGNKIDFGSNQVQAPNLMALAAARQQATTPASAPAGQAGIVAPGTPKGAGIARTALTQVGIPYQWGGKAELGSHTDCSGLLQASARANGVNIGRTTYQQWKQGTAVDPAHIQEGDAVFFHMGPKGPEHVGIALGNGKFVEDPHTGDKVKVADLANYPGFVGARRFG